MKPMNICSHLTMCYIGCYVAANLLEITFFYSLECCFSLVFFFLFKKKITEDSDTVNTAV